MKAPFWDMKLVGGREVDPITGQHYIKAVVSIRRFWLPFAAAEMVEPWWWKPLVFAWAAWRFWVRRSP